MEYLSTDKLQETWNERKNILFFFNFLGLLCVIGTGQADDIGFFISGWIKSSRQKQRALRGSPCQGNSGLGWFSGRTFQGWKAGGCGVGKGIWDARDGIVESWQELWAELSMGTIPSCRAESSSTAPQAAGIPSHPTLLLPVMTCELVKWNHHFWTSLLTFAAPSSSPVFSYCLPQDSLSLLAANPQKHQHFTAQTLWPDPHRIFFFFFFQKSPVFYGLAPKRKQHTSQEQEGMKLFQIPGPQTVLMPPKSLIAAHHPLLPLLCHSRSSPAAGITSIIGFFTVRMPHRNDIIPSLSTWSHSFPMLALANISSSSTTTYKPPMWFVLSEGWKGTAWELLSNCSKIHFLVFLEALNKNPCFKNSIIGTDETSRQKGFGDQHEFELPSPLKTHI